MQPKSLESLSLTIEEKEIYNHYLKALAEASNRPYKRRIDFNKFKSEDAESLKKLSLFFNKYKHIYPFNFFRAGFAVTEEKYLSLSYFTKYKAISDFTKYSSSKYDSPADSEKSLKSFKEGICFILNFLYKNNLSIGDYRTCVNSYSCPWFMIHLKEQRISFYHFHVFGIQLSQIPEDYKELVCSSFDDKFKKTLSMYMTSCKMKEIGNKVTKRIK